MFKVAHSFISKIHVNTLNDYNQDQTMDVDFEITENVLMVSIIFICIGTFFVCLLLVICLHLYHLFAYLCNCIRHTSTEKCRYPDICESILNEAQDINNLESEKIFSALNEAQDMDNLESEKNFSTLNEAQDIDNLESEKNIKCCQHVFNDDLKYVIYYV